MVFNLMVALIDLKQAEKRGINFANKNKVPHNNDKCNNNKNIFHLRSFLSVVDSSKGLDCIDLAMSKC